MSGMIGLGGKIVETPATSKTWPGFPCVSQQRLPTDPVFIADVTIANAVVGSSYILLGPDGTTVLAGPGTIATDPQTLSNVSAFSDAYVMELRLRKSTSGTRYKKLNQFVAHVIAGASFYVVQQVDNVLP